MVGGTASWVETAAMGSGGSPRQTGPRTGTHFYEHGRLLGNTYNAPITIQCKSKVQCDQVHTKLKSPTFTSAVASAAGVPASAFKTISEPMSYETRAYTTTTTTVHTTGHSHTTTTIIQVEDGDKKWRNPAIALAVVCGILLIAVVALSLSGKKKGQQDSVRANDMEKTLGGNDEEAYDV
jgi:hypothetical protein